MPINGARPSFLVWTDADEFAVGSLSNPCPVANREQQSKKNQGSKKVLRNLVARFSKLSV